MKPLAILLVGCVDRRLLPALEFVRVLDGYDTRAVHVAEDPALAAKVAVEWMGLDVGLPLEIEEAGSELVSVVYEVVDRERASGRPQVLVVVPELDIGKWWQVMLHRTSGRRLARHLQTIDHVTTAVFPYAVHPVNV